jgi:hypothetical protein
MIKVNPYREVVLTRPCTVAFLTENAHNDLLLGAVDEIERMLFNQIESDRKEVKCEYECNWCKKGFKSKSGHTVHIKTCNSRPKTNQ